MSGDTRYADWIGVDWGTSKLRAWAMTSGGEVRAEAQSDDGMGRLARDEFEPALIRLIEPWLGAAQLPVIACGMVGSRQGWAEAPYMAVPCAPLSDRLTSVDVQDPRVSVWLVAGLKQDQPADVMRGEETQLAGFLAQNNGFDGIVCLPGTHTKWVQISAGEVVSFRTFMTGEIFHLMSEKSVLRHSLLDPVGWDQTGFVDAMLDAMSRPAAMSAQLFRLRADALLHELPARSARARLSGYLIGIELAAARPYWLGQKVAIIGTRSLSRIYDAALQELEVPTRASDAAAATLSGLSEARTSLLEATK